MSPLPPAELTGGTCPPSPSPRGGTWGHDGFGRWVVGGIGGEGDKGKGDTLSTLTASPPRVKGDVTTWRGGCEVSEGRWTQARGTLSTLTASPPKVKGDITTWRDFDEHGNPASFVTAPAVPRAPDFARASAFTGHDGPRFHTKTLVPVHAAGECSWRALEKADLWLPEDEEEAKRRRQRAMKGKRKEAAQVNENGEVRGVPGMGEKNPLTSWICVRVEWSKAYARVKRWHEETCLLQEEMVRCLLTLDWQAAQWDRRAMPTHYNGQIQYSAVHLQGAMALAARQAAVWRKLAGRFRRSWWRLLDRVARPPMADSAQSSAEDGDEDWDNEEEGPAAEAVDPGKSRGRAAEREEEDEEEEEGAEGEGEGGEDAERRRAEMDELFAIQTTSLEQYDEHRAGVPAPRICPLML
ncbi:hypothetical protein B0H13DRAFT_2390344 [Mycena leptocephala]|nr:hypothetical protein B0H13DRAFT_2390344 [Mycena leptocephala]